MTNNDPSNYEIFFFHQGEKELVEDLTLVLKVFHGPMKQLGLVSEEELSLIFGNVEELVSVHQSLVDKLVALQNQIGVYDNVAETITEWVSYFSILDFSSFLNCTGIE